jgi:hypothetical protein
MEHVTLPVLDDAGARVISYEVVETERHQDGTLHMLHSPAFVAGIARGDRIELDPSALAGFRILQRGGMLAAVVVFVGDEQKQEAVRQLDPEVQSLGGVCEGGPGRALVFSVPVATGFPTTEAFFEEACRRFPGAQWYFGNVYGDDGKPLNWWV